MDTYILSWSGGKDSALALCEARAAGLDVSFLLTMLTPAGFTASHRIPRPVLRRQAEAVGLPLVEGVAEWEDYESEFERVLSGVRQRGVTGCVFGDIDLAQHVEWGRRVCREVGLRAVHPFWGSSQEQVMDRIIGLGLEAVVVVVETGKLGPEWLGRRIDLTAVQQLRDLGVSVSGESGEYHTLVVGGPVFRWPPFDGQRAPSGGEQVPVGSRQEPLEQRPGLRGAAVLTRGSYAFWDLSRSDFSRLSL